MDKIGQVLVSGAVQGLAQKARAISMRLLLTRGWRHVLVLVVLLHLFNPCLPGLLLLLTETHGPVCYYA